jgi:fatty-acyl-CoA synthase
VVVLVECRTSNEGEMEALRREVLAQVLRSCGITCEVVLVAPRSLPFTSSGKLSRLVARARYLSGEIGQIGRGQQNIPPRQMAAAS